MNSSIARTILLLQWPATLLLLEKIGSGKTIWANCHSSTCSVTNILRIVAIGGAEDAQVVLENCLDKDVVYRFLRPWLGHGLFVAPGKYFMFIHRHHRNY